MIAREHAILLRDVRERAIEALDLLDEITRDPWNRAYGSEYEAIEHYLRGVGLKLEDVCHIINYLMDEAPADG